MLSVTARDNGDPSRSAEGIVEVNVVSGTFGATQKVRFRNDTYGVEVEEGVETGAQLLVCQAYRVSNGRSEGLQYQIVSGNEAGAFGIENWSGKS